MIRHHSVVSVVVAWARTRSDSDRETPLIMAVVPCGGKRRDQRAWTGS
jgi:hypothetical protein